MKRNIELKARLQSIEQARQVAEQRATDRLPDQRQLDTYFDVRRGRLKLREINSNRAELIWYQRENLEQSKESRYGIVAVQQPAQLKGLLAASLGVLAIVDKRRSIWLYHRVRIHLDEVEGLGAFIEFEAVLAENQPAEEGHRAVAELQEAFDLRPTDLLAASYSDLIQK